MKSIKYLSAPTIAALLCAPAFAVTSESFNFDDGLVPAGATIFGTTEVRATGGNPDGYLSLTDALFGQRGSIVFPDLTGGETLTDFKIEADLRMGGGTDLPADGVSFNIARPGDSVLDDGNGWAASPGGFSSVEEEGTTTGLAIGFDEWLNGGDDVIGISIRVDNVVVDQIEVPTLNGALDDITSLQTGPNTGGLDALGWAPVSIMLAADQTLTVEYKGTVFFNEVIAMAPITGGQLVIGGRTGGANAYHHLDNLTFMANSEAPGSAVPEPLSATLSVMAAFGVLGSATRRRRG